MILMNLEQSGFRKLKLVKQASNVIAGGVGKDSRNQDLAKFLKQIFDKIDKSVEPSKFDVNQLLAQPSVVLLIDKFISKHQEDSNSKKNATKSTEYRTRGNQKYGRGQFSPAAYYYTMAIIYAPDVAENDDNVDKKFSEELSLAYGNRSAVFNELGQYEAALDDIDHSLATGYPREKQSKLLLRKVECLISLKHFREAKRVWEQLCSSGNETKDDERAIKIRRKLLDIDSNVDYQQHRQLSSSTDAVLNYLTRTGRYKPSTDFASLSVKVEPLYSPDTAKGRHLVAKQDIEPGDILMVESPFASVLSKHFEYHFCHHCCRKLESKIGETEELCITGSLIPCTQCTRVLFCSTRCRTEAWRTYHQYECSILSVLHQIPCSSHLSLRILLATGLEVIQKVIDRNSQDDESKDPLSSLKIGDPGDSESHYGLVCQLLDQKDSHLPEFVIFSAVLVQLTKKCDFVRTSEQAKLASTILLRQLLQLYATASKIDGFEFSERDKFNDFAVALYPFHSTLMNHSCEPNCVPSFVQSTELILRATKRIPAGSQVTVSYTHQDFQEWSERRKLIWKSWCFRCECARCVLEARDGLNGKYFPIACHKCGSTLTRTSSSSDTFHCSKTSCASSMALSEAKQLYAQIESQFATATRLLVTFEGGPIENLLPLLQSQHCLLELSNIKGLKYCWQIGEFHRRISYAFKKIDYKKETRIHFGRYCEIREMYSGIADAIDKHHQLIDLYLKYDDADRVGPPSVSRHLIKHFRQIENRMLQLIRLTLLADVEPPTDGLDLLVDESRHLRKLYQRMVRLGGLIRVVNDGKEDIVIDNKYHDEDEFDEETLHKVKYLRAFLYPKF